MQIQYKIFLIFVIFFIFIVSVDALITITDNQLVLNTSISNSSMTFSKNITLDYLRITSINIYLENVTANSAICTINHTKENTNLDSSTFCVVEVSSTPSGSLIIQNAFDNFTYSNTTNITSIDIFKKSLRNKKFIYFSLLFFIVISLITILLILVISKKHEDEEQKEINL